MPVPEYRYRGAGTGKCKHPFWNSVNEKVYESCFKKPFKTKTKIKRKIRSVWRECAGNTTEIRKASKQFVPRLKAVVENEGYPIKTYLDNSDIHLQSDFGSFLLGFGTL